MTTQAAQTIGPESKRGTDSSSPATLALTAIAVALILVYRAWARDPELNSDVPSFIGLALLAGALYLVAVYLVRRFQLGPTALLVTLGASIGFRVLLLAQPPALSDDVYRYQWEGRVERLHLNPYIVSPDSPGLAKLEDPEHRLETGRTVPSLYPPLSEIVFAWIDRVPSYKRTFTGLDLASVGLLLLMLARVRQPLHRVLIYAWNPAVVIAFSLSGHHDSLAIFTLLTAQLAIIAHRPLAATAALALATLAKFFPVVLLPVFLEPAVSHRPHGSAARADASPWARLAVFAGLVVAGYLPFAGAGFQVFRGLKDYATGWEANDSLFGLLEAAGNSRAQAELVAAIIVAVLVAFVLRRRLEPLRAGLILTAGLVLVSPDAFPWYFTWSVPFLCFYPSAPWLLATVLSVLGYAPVIGYTAGLPYKHAPLILALEYLPVYAWLGWEAWQSLGRRS